MNSGRFSRVNRGALVAFAALLVVGGCEAGGATLVDPSDPAAPSAPSSPSSPSPVQRVSVNPTSVTAVVGGPAQAVAATVDVSPSASPTVTWTTSDTTVARVTPKGDSAMVTGLKPGTATVTATSTADHAKHGDATVQVVNPSAAPPATIAISAPASSIAVSAATQGVAVVRDAAGNTLAASVTWASSNAQVAAVSSSGVITGIAAGTASITATSGSVTSNALTITVTAITPVVASVTVTASGSAVAAFQTLQAQAVVKDAGGNVLSGQRVTWTSGNPSVATVDGNGLVTGVAPGAVTITATAGSVTSNALALTVVNPPVATITVTAPSSSMGLLSTMQAQAVAKDASGHVLQGITFSWASSNSAAATVSSSGLITAVLAGTTEITASSGSVTSSGFTVTVTLLP